MSYFTLNLKRVASLGFFLWTAWMPQELHSQIATPAPAAPDSVLVTPAPASSKRPAAASPAAAPVAVGNESKNPINPKESGFVNFLMGDAFDRMQKKEYPSAIASFEAALMHSQAEGLPEDRKNSIKIQFANGLYSGRDFSNAIRVLNDLSQSNSDPKISMLRAAAYHEANWESAMMDELRRTLRLDPNNITVRGGFAEELLTTKVRSLRNAKEALNLLTPLEDRIVEEPRYAKMIAMAAAETGDFDRAVRMQKRYLQSGATMDRERESTTLGLYEDKHVPPMAPSVELDRTKLLSNQEIANIARKSMVRVKVHREFELKETDSGETAKTTTVHTHVGTVLSSMGTILVSSETVRPPRFDEFAARKLKGTVRMLKDQLIEVYSMATDSDEPQFITQAKVIGIDEATGLAVLELDVDKQFRCVRVDVLHPVKFMPEFREFDPNTARHLSKTFELTAGSTARDEKPSFKEVTIGESKAVAYHDWTQNAPTMAKLIHVGDNEGLVGAPLFNQLGECIGIRHEVGFDKPRNVAIPSAICTRVAAKLASHGKVDRPYFPFKTSGMLTGAKMPSMGMRISDVIGSVPIYGGLVNNFIISLDGVATPSLTEWLIASERISAIGQETALVEVYDPKLNVISMMTLPAKPNPVYGDSNAAASSKIESPKPLDSRAMIEEASQWIVRNTDADRELLDTCIQEFDRILRAKRNVACYFGSEVAKDGQYQSLFIRDGEVFGRKLSPRTAELLDLSPTTGAITEFGESKPKPQNAFEITNLRFKHGKDADLRPIIIVNLGLHNLTTVNQKTFLRIQFAEKNVSPILLPLVDPPSGTQSKPISLSAVPTEKHRTGLIGGMVLVDVVALSGNVQNAEYTSISNQLADYAQLVDDDFAEMFLKLREYSEPDSPVQKKLPALKR